jgi:hypothetical protein
MGDFTRNPNRPSDNAEAAAAQHQPSEPSVQPPHMLAILLADAPPKIKHRPAGQSTQDIGKNLKQKLLNMLQTMARHVTCSYEKMAAGWAKIFFFLTVTLALP